jgi:RNA polymerase sigma-70 factor (ECF subfamily)
MPFQGDDPASEDAWVAGLRSGRPEAFELLYALYFRRVYDFASRRVASRTDAEDITHETFLEVLRASDGVEACARVEAWIFGVARNVLRQHARAERRRGTRERAAPVGNPPPTPEAELAARRLADAVGRELGGADAWQREAFRLHFLEGVPVREIARRTACSRHALGVSLGRMRRRVLHAAEGGVRPGP